MSSVLLSKMNPDQVFSPNTDREIERISREAELIRQRDRQELAEDKSPLEDPIRDEPEENQFDMMLDALSLIFKRRLQ